MLVFHVSLVSRNSYPLVEAHTSRTPSNLYSPGIPLTYSTLWASTSGMGIYGIAFVPQGHPATKVSLPG